MAKKNIKLTVPFESLVECVSKLTVQDKLHLLALLESELAQIEEDAWEQDPSIVAEIQEARVAYEAGDYITIDEYLECKKENG
jgi:hypothetical protein